MIKKLNFISFLLFATLFIGLTTNTIANDEDNEDDEDYEIDKLKESDEYRNLPKILSCTGEGEGYRIAKSLLCQKDCFK